MPYITKRVFCEDFRLDAALAGTNAEPNQQAAAKFAKWASHQAVARIHHGMHFCIAIESIPHWSGRQRAQCFIR